MPREGNSESVDMPCNAVGETWCQVPVMSADDTGPLFRGKRERGRERNKSGEKRLAQRPMY